ncbi:hypothetical protein [Aestuariivita boseongensis]|uniref:hypothetical protein n=1 Tax=Aestuariivita boseongensis TaxID=1470562 RepID=UPI000682478E|nr:hypothetical protein [Aestuariivita boseongensis]
MVVLRVIFVLLAFSLPLATYFIGKSHGAYEANANNAIVSAIQEDRCEGLVASAEQIVSERNQFSKEATDLKAELNEMKARVVFLEASSNTESCPKQ